MGLTREEHVDRAVKKYMVGDMFTTDDIRKSIAFDFTTRTVAGQLRKNVCVEHIKTTTTAIRGGGMWVRVA